MNRHNGSCTRRAAVLFALAGLGSYAHAQVQYGPVARHMTDPGDAAVSDAYIRALKCDSPGLARFCPEKRKLRADESPVAGRIGAVGRAVEEKVISAASLAAPKAARQAFEKGRDNLRKNRPEEARKSFEKAVALYPDYASAWQELGKLQFAAKQNEQARSSFETAIKTDPTSIDAYLGLAAIHAYAQAWQELLETTRRALTLNSYSYPQLYFLNAVAEFNLHDEGAAERSARKAQMLDASGRYPGIFRLLGVILVNQQDYDHAAEQMRLYLKYAPNSPASNEVRIQLSQIERAAAQSQQAPQN